MRVLKSPFLKAVCISVSVLVFTPTTRAADPGITLADAIAMATRSNPALAGQRFAIAEAAARRDLAALKPPLVLGADIENVLGTRSTFGNLEATLRLGTVVELGDKRRLRANAAEAVVTSANLQRDIQALDLLADVTRRFIANLAAQAKVEIAHEHVERARVVVDAITARIAAGIGSPVERGNAIVHLKEMELALAAAQVHLRRTWGLLAATWAAPPDGTGRATGDLFALEPLAAFAQVAAQIDRNPRFGRMAAERAAAEAHAGVVRAQRAPDVTVSAGVRRFEAQRDQVLVLGLSVPLGSAGRNIPAEQEAAARVSRAASAESAARLDNMATLYGLYEEAAQARTAVLAWRRDIQPVAEETLARAEEGFRAGRFSLFEVSTAQDQLHHVEEAAVEAAETYHRAVAEIERLTAAPVEHLGETP